MRECLGVPEARHPTVFDTFYVPQLYSSVEIRLAKTKAESQGFMQSLWQFFEQETLGGLLAHQKQHCTLEVVLQTYGSCRVEIQKKEGIPESAVVTAGVVFLTLSPLLSLVPESSRFACSGLALGRE